MIKLQLLLLCFLSAWGIQAQTNAAKPYAALVHADGLKKDLTIIAGDEFEGRETGTEGQRKAAAYIAAQFKAMGLKAVKGTKKFQQYYPLYQDSLAGSMVSIGGIEGVYGTDYLVNLSNNAKGKIKANEIIFVGYGIEAEQYNDYKNVDVKGKVVLFFMSEPKKDGNFLLTGTKRGSQWSGVRKKLELAATKGAVGAIVLNAGLAEFSATQAKNGRRGSQYFPSAENGGKIVNYISVSHAFAKTIFKGSSNFDSLITSAKNGAVFSNNGEVVATKVNIAINLNRKTVMASNVLGMVKGSEKPDEYVFITGHYDHLGKHDGKIYYGADDDGSGTCAVIALARAFSKAKAEGKGPKRSIIFMTVSGEEKGLWGSEYYSDHPLVPLDKTSVDLNIDMIGRNDTERHTSDSNNYVYVVGHDKISSDLPKINEAENTASTQLTLDYKFDDPNDKNRIYFRSDHYNFARKGVPVLFFYDGMLKADYHQPSDTVDKINWELYEKRAQMIFYTAWAMANYDNMLIRDKPLPTATR